MTLQNVTDSSLVCKLAYTFSDFRENPVTLASSGGKK